MLNLSDVVVAAFEIDLEAVSGAIGQSLMGLCEVYVFDGDQIAGGLFHGFVDYSETPTWHQTSVIIYAQQLSQIRTA